MSEHTVSEEKPLVDVRDMIVVHTAMLREFRLAPAAVARASTPRQVKVVAAHLQFLCELLHHHHEGEDELLWPKLKARTSASVIDDVEAQHAGLDLALASVGSALTAWAVGPSASDLLVTRLRDLYTKLEEHLDLEEQALLPLAAAHLTDAEWHAVGEAAVASMPKSALLLSFGMFCYEGDPAVLRDMLSSAPPPVRFLLPRIAPRVYARRARQVHGTDRP